VPTAVDAAVAAFGKLYILMNNAGTTKRADFVTLTEEDWQDGFALKFHGYVRATRAAWPHLRETRGCVVNIIGVGSLAGSAEFTIGGAVDADLRRHDDWRRHFAIARRFHNSHGRSTSPSLVFIAAAASASLRKVGSPSRSASLSTRAFTSV
jgi:NAD(P)-dependent dehydrogenase (short-subunit alcohol dehydrogenase family)